MFQEFIVCTFFYVVIVAIAYQPKRNAVTAEIPVNYFPEVEEEEETPDWEKEAIAVAVDFKPVVIAERRPVAAFVAPKAPAVDYSAMSIRELKEAAKARTGKPNAIKKYSRMTRELLIQELAK